MLVLLADEVMPGGRTLVELGLDHFLKAPDIERRSLVLLHLLLERAGATGSTVHASPAVAVSEDERDARVASRADPR